ncbi:MAG TPA: HAMP domain-containing sensor histidine kinase [Gemmatimonadota bacterium]|jgi:signal transduction histidine kinase
MNQRPSLGGIRTKTLAAFASLVALLVVISGLVWYRLTTSHLEREIDSRLLSVAELGRTNFSYDLIFELVRAVDEVSPDEFVERNSYLNALSKIQNLKHSSGAKNVYIFDRSLRILASTDSSVTPGYAYPLLRGYGAELAAVFAGSERASMRFDDDRGNVYQSAFAPLYGQEGGPAIAALGVDLNVAFLDVLRDFRRTTIWITALGIAVAIAMGLVFARTLTRPITELVVSAQRMEHGNLSEPVPIPSRDEIGYLGAAMEDMRQGILRRDKHLRTMLAGVAHEIRNPLGGIEIFATLLRDELAHEDGRREHLRKIIQEVHHLKTIVNEFLVYARPRQPISEPFSLNRIVDDLRFLVGADLVEKGLDLQVELGRDELFVFADGDQIKRALLNLVRNSVQASRPGGRIELKAQRADEKVRVTVKDFGQGIPPADLRFIFDPFFTTKGSGAGLGLSIVKSIVEENDGEIRVESVPGEFTLFVVVLPAARAVTERFRDSTSASPRDGEHGLHDTAAGAGSRAGAASERG